MRHSGITAGMPDVRWHSECGGVQKSESRPLILDGHLAFEPDVSGCWFDCSKPGRPVSYVPKTRAYGHGSDGHSKQLLIFTKDKKMEPNVQSARIATDGSGPRLMSADTLDGEKVRNTAGEDLGSIEHIMLDVPNGSIAYAVLSFGGFLGVGDKLFAVPWLALKLDTENKCFVLDVSKDQLEKAPGFDKDHWPTMANEAWGRGIHSHYGTAPYWDRHKSLAS
jgi:sporulation protein YlmC with PRC-barrel domain